MDGASNSPQGMKIPGGLTSTPAQKSTIPLIMELSGSDEDDEGEEGVEVIEDSDNDDGKELLWSSPWYKWPAVISRVFLKLAEFDV